jgi:hypothetical protein
MPADFQLFRQATLTAWDFARLKAGSSRLARMPMMAMTTSNSIRVKARGAPTLLARSRREVAD